MAATFLGEVFETQQGTFCLSPADQGVSRELRESGQYGVRELVNLKNFVNRQSSVLLIGAHVGALVVPLSKSVGGIDAIEANPNTFKLLEINLRLNNCQNVTAHNVAANDTGAAVEFVLNTVNSGGSKRMPLVREKIYFYDNPKVVKVPSAVLDELFVDRVFDLIFMDIEGSEYFAMKGMPKLLSRAGGLVTEFIPHHLKNVAGIGVADFLLPLSEFQTLIVPTLQKVVHQPDFHAVLQSMMDRGLADDGIAFLKTRTEVTFNP